MPLPRCPADYRYFRQRQDKTREYMKRTNENAAKVAMWNRNFTCVVIAIFLHCMAHFSVNPLVASYMVYLGQSALVMGLLTGMFFGVSLAMRPFAGPVMIKIDKRMLMIMVFSLGGTVNLGYALFHNIPAFVVCRFLTGMQYSIVGSLMLTLAGDNLPREKLASGMGVYGLGNAIGMALGPAVGIKLLSLGTNIISESAGYTMVFLSSSVIYYLALIPAFLIAPDKKTGEDIKNAGPW